VAPTKGFAPASPVGGPALAGREEFDVARVRSVWEGYAGGKCRGDPRQSEVFGRRGYENHRNYPAQVQAESAASEGLLAKRNAQDDACLHRLSAEWGRAQSGSAETVQVADQVDADSAARCCPRASEDGHSPEAGFFGRAGRLVDVVASLCWGRPMSLSRQDVEKVSLLARLRLEGDELDLMTTQLGEIVGYVDQLSELDTAEVPPMAHAVEMANVFADDIARPSFEREAILANAPKRDDECYRVPAVLGE